MTTDPNLRISLLSAPFPCPDCVGTMLPGVTYSYPAPPATKGTGKKYYPYSGAANAFSTVGLSLGDCYRCKGTGLVNERRRTDRRSGKRDRRTYVDDTRYDEELFP